MAHLSEGGGYKSAIPILEKGVARYPGEDFYRLMLARVYLDGGDVQPAQALLANPSFDTAQRHLLLYRVASIQHRNDRAMSELQAAMAMDSNDPTAFHIQVCLAAHCGDSQAIISACREVLRLDVCNSATHETLANALVVTGNLEEAQKHRTWAQTIQAALAHRH